MGWTACADSAKDISKALCKACSSVMPAWKDTEGGITLCAETDVGIRWVVLLVLLLLLVLTPLDTGLEFAAVDDLDPEAEVEEAPWDLTTAACPALDRGLPSVLQSWSNG